MTKFVNFSQALITSLPTPDKGHRLVVKDTQVVGLQCRVTSTGVKTFSLYRRVRGGNVERFTLGKFGDLTVKMARDNAIQINAAIARGENPSAIRRTERKEITFGELFLKYLENHSKVKKGTWKEDIGRFNNYLKKPLGNKKVSDITRIELVSLHAAISRQPKVKKKRDGTLKSGGTANRALALVSSIFSWAMNHGYCTEHPALRIKKNPEKSRDRFLQPDELPKFYKAVLEEENTSIRDFILVALFTGARRTNILTMRWEDVALDRKEWRIPKTKNGDPQVIPLTNTVIQILKARKASTGFVFPAEGKAGHLIEPKKGWKRILKRAGIDGLRMHDLRRTFGSWQARTGSSLIIVGKSLGHKSMQSTAVYSRLDLAPVRQSVEKATEAILKVAMTLRIKFFQVAQRTS